MSNKNKKGRVANSIKDLRKEAGLSQQALAEKAGATRQTINAIEQEKYAPSLELAFRIAQVLGVPFETVFQFLADD